MQGSGNDEALAWTITGITAGYVIWVGFTLSRRVSTFADLFSSLGVDLTPAARIVIGASRPGFVWPLVAVVLFVLVVNQFRNRRHVRLAVSVIVFLVAAVLASLITEAMFVPLFQLIRQIG